MLYISETEATLGKIAMQEVNITGVVRDACELFQPVAEDKGVNLVVEIKNDLKVRGVLQGLQRMLANLIDNALNYTPRPGTVTVWVSGNENLGTIAIQDTGIGIAPRRNCPIFSGAFTAATGAARGRAPAWD